MDQTQHAATRAGSLIGGALLRILIERIPAFAVSFYGPRGLRLVLNIATALLVVSLPFVAAQSTSAATATEPATYAVVTSLGSDDGATTRAQTASRGLLAGTRSVTTVAAQDVRPVLTYEVKKGDTLSDVASQYSIPADDLAYANGFSDDNIAPGEKLLIPPGHGALYFVKSGDTVASVADKFKVDQSVIMGYNRLYFEPEHFAPDQLIFVPGAEVPAVKRTQYGTLASVPLGQLPARAGRLSWPVNGIITQYFWWGHTGVDIAAPYGSTLTSSDDGVVVATGWVAVGGLRVCVQHAEGLQTCYYHTGSILVSPGQSVSRGQPIATIGLTGVTTGPHVHWELKVNGVAVNPLLY
jgi:murein DD-endopeptidase MepM/ murein hydrolase activator NlpD